MSKSITGINIKRYRESLGISQESLGDAIGVTKSTISNWEIGKSYPKRGNLLKLSQELNVSVYDIENSTINEEADKSYISKCNELKMIPFYTNVRASAGHGFINNDETFKYVHIEDLPPNSNFKCLFCILATGDSMEPVLKHGSLIVVDTSKTDIIDGKMYVFCQDDTLRIKIFSYEKQLIRVKSYNNNYADELYRFDEMSKLKIIGQVVYFSTKLN
ncbi:XRE family transcriptional regulator [Vibrio sp. ArtGut-C1]|uniref:XRE family transcriptional regulator n=1 Tax=Vibrio sp. ArtGut-C1 TaxID=2259137 RepID=UPI000A18A630|nr:XRE family transcriptional regulator [Vibrio sp. ArtGut-C1]